jgi:YARHG domain
LEGVCDVNSIKKINDSLFEVKAGAGLYAELYDSTKTIVGGTYYHYLTIKNNKMSEMRNNRTFAFTKYVKMDDSYLNGCYNLLIGSVRYDQGAKKTIDHITPEMLRYIKNEIYADYGYAFKDKRWKTVFMDMQSYYKSGEQDWPGNTTVEDSLTEIDKYNINWINQKLKESKTNSSALASR